MAVEKDIKKDEQEALQAYATVNEIQNAYFNLNYPGGLSSFANYVVPRDYLNQIKEAKRLRKFDIVDRLFKIRKDYTLSIKRLKCSKKGQQKFYDEYVLPLVRRFARQWLVERYSVGECFAHYGFKKVGDKERIPMYLRLENPENITPIEFLGFEAYEIRLGSGVKEQIKKLKAQNAIDKLPSYLQKAINKDGYISDKITLTQENMYRTSDLRQDYEERVEPPILKIAKQLMLRSFLLDLDYVNAFASQKTSIVHTQCGDKDTINQWDNQKIKGIHDLVTMRPPGQAFVTTRYDVKINSVNINLNEMFDPKKFEQCNADIMNFVGIPIVFIPTKAGEVNNSVVIVSLKPLEQSIKTDREVFEEFLKVYFEQINERNGFSELPTVEYKHTNIRGDNELIKELQFLTDRGVLSFEDVCLEFDYDRDEQLEKKRFDWDNRDVEAPVIELSQGTSPMLTSKFKQELELKSKTSSDLNLPKSSQTKNKQKNDNK